MMSTTPAPAPSAPATDNLSCVTDVDVAPLSPLSDACDSFDSVAFFFIKPGAVNDDVDALVRTRLSDRGVHVLKEGRINGKELEKVIDKHYGTLAERALHVSPADLPALSDQAEAAFADAFGLSWTDALEQGRVLNLAEAKVKAGVFPEKTSPFDIEAAWRAGKCVKLFPGTYVAAIPALNGNSDAVGQAAARQSVFVVNGFYGAMREIFVQSPVGVAWKVVAWNSSPPSSSFPSSSSLPSSSSSSTAPITASPMTLSWADFREQLVGATDPSRALPTSLRGELLKQWKSLGLAAPPAGADNGFHASASPLESLREREIWLHGDGTSSPIKNDPLIKLLAAAGVSEPNVLRRLCSNPRFAEDGGAPLFDVVEHMDTVTCAKALVSRLQREINER